MFIDASGHMLIGRPFMGDRTHITLLSELRL